MGLQRQKFTLFMAPPPCPPNFDFSDGFFLRGGRGAEMGAARRSLLTVNNLQLRQERYFAVSPPCNILNSLLFERTISPRRARSCDWYAITGDFGHKGNLANGSKLGKLVFLDRPQPGLLALPNRCSWDLTQRRKDSKTQR